MPVSLDAAALPAGFAALLAAEAAAYALPGTGEEAADLEQAVWLRLLERDGPPADPAGWTRAAVRAEALGADVRRRCERPYADQDAGPPPRSPHRAGDVEDRVIAADAQHAVLAAVPALPGRCPELVRALLSGSDRTYREISQELGISQGSLGPLRSRCLGCLRSMVNSRVGAPVGRGNAR
ncbi:sigma-70 family RNA polymerase sigma factor [Actinacidiphila paucisporea]|uniref:DNA-directed RNA polymerase specialized sigma subunit, sigma24 family n=1 Tax=Actinacidiphila paucisporea TaxID=310782 RepID=A0A1M7J797_9ACTN|nr:sigma-70 family RNA polymerase sigma factor [Actinacidiphila paucisporea]SHM48969.1 DNA-directed RNA polymerase specialized sigma subunit, sigma24 family [Actinacidiphila paucisporea]